MEAYLKRQIEDRRQETKVILENSSDPDQFAKDVLSRLVLANEQNQEGMNDLELVRYLINTDYSLQNIIEIIRADTTCLAWKCERAMLFIPLITHGIYGFNHCRHLLHCWQDMKPLLRHLLRPLRCWRSIQRSKRRSTSTSARFLQKQET
jgi:hypothetical protein